MPFVSAPSQLSHTALLFAAVLALVLYIYNRGASASGAAEMMRGKRRPPRATSSGLGREMMREMQLSFTDSVTNTTGSSEASPRRG
jgi:hypothetical protein